MSNTPALTTNSSYLLALLLHVAIPFSHITHFCPPLSLHDAPPSEVVQGLKALTFLCTAGAFQYFSAGRLGVKNDSSKKD
jgi:hypothetical protein